MPKKKKKKNVVYKYNYYDEMGKRRCKSFSAPTMTEAKQLSEEWEINRSKTHVSSMTVSEAVKAYIDMQEPVLSPSTVRAYRSIEKHRIPQIDIPLNDLSAQTAQVWINRLVMEDLSPKTVRNCFALLTAAVHLKDKTIDLTDVKLPQPQRYIGHTPSDEEIQKLIDYAKNTGKRDLYIAILLAAFGPLRRSEVCALTDQDVNGNEITINKSIVKDDLGVWHIKAPKTRQSARIVSYPDFVIAEIKDIKGPLVNCDPDQLHHRFRRAIKYSKSVPFRFHDLRHYGASIMHALGVPDIYIMQRGGWSTDYVMKRVYINAMDEEKKKQTDIINSHFSNLKQNSEANKHIS